MIYFVEDDSSIRELVVYTLGSIGLETTGFSRPSEFWHAMDTVQPTLILLDIMLPEEDGLEILKKLRTSVSSAKIPVMMLSAKDSEYDKVIGLDLGADDYLAKPFGMMELIARVRALLRRFEPKQEETTYTLGKLFVSPQKHLVRVGKTEVILTRKEFELLCLLLENQDIVMTRDTLLNQIWGYAFDGENRTIDVHIRTLRQKLGEAGTYIETVRGIGYKIGNNVNEV